MIRIILEYKFKPMINFELAWVFLKKVFSKLEESNIDIINLELDHICYRVDTKEKYIKYKQEILKNSELLSENIISWRNISTFKLNNPIVYKNRKIRILELPEPKEWSYYDEWFEHIEFVIKDSFKDFIEKYNNLEFITKSCNKKVNPDIKLKFWDISVKFHHNTLEYVIKYLK